MSTWNTKNKRNPKLDEPSLSLYDILGDIIKLKRGDLHEHPEFEKAYSKFMIQRYLSMDENSAEMNAVTLQATKTLDDVSHYKTMVKLIPQSNNAFIKYIKGKKN